MLEIYNSLTHKKEKFEPLVPGKVGIGTYRFKPGTDIGNTGYRCREVCEESVCHLIISGVRYGLDDGAVCRVKGQQKQRAEDNEEIQSALFLLQDLIRLNG